VGLTKVLVANRGEIAIRIVRACFELGITSVAIYSSDDADSLHRQRADESYALDTHGPRAYTDVDRIVSIAQDSGCDAIHPGYGFLSENALFAQRCADAGITFVGPTSETLILLGDKAAARSLATNVAVPVLPGTSTGISVAEAAAFLASLGPGRAMILKGVAGGGGRGQRVVSDPDSVGEAYARCQSEAAAFGNTELFAEAFLSRARHVEVQVIGDGNGGVSHLWDRDCTVQRRHQKLIEIAPAPALPDTLREKLFGDSIRLAEAIRYRSLGTFEFLVELDGGEERYFFLEANPRLQVEHTVTEEVLGLDLVQLQLLLASGASRLADLGIEQSSVPTPRGTALELRVNAETMSAAGAPQPETGVITTFEIPSGPGCRTDTFGYAGYQVTGRFDSLLAKVVVHSRAADLAHAIAKGRRALTELRVVGVATNAPFLQSILDHPDLLTYSLYTRFVDDHMAELLADAAERSSMSIGQGAAGAGAGVGDLGSADWDEDDEGMVSVTAPMPGTVVALEVAEGNTVSAGDPVIVLEAMKMEHVVAADVAGYVRKVLTAVGRTVSAAAPVVLIERSHVEDERGQVDSERDLDHVPAALAEVSERHAGALDAARPDAVAMRHARGRRTTRENIDDLCDGDSFVEHGGLVVTPDSGLPLEEAARRFPGDGMICGIGSVNRDLFGDVGSKVAVLSYDYTVLAGTQGPLSHAKTDRLLNLARTSRLPVVVFTEGGGGRAGTGGNRGSDAESRSNGGPRTSNMRRGTFATMGRLKGIVPTVAINSGHCFAGNAALLGACDVVIAAADSHIGMGGPAMIEGAGLGRYRPDEVGPLEVQLKNGVVDIAVEDEAAAVAVVKQYLSYFQGRVGEWSCGDQRELRHLVPENRLRAYDARHVIDSLADTGSVLELRRSFGLGMVTALARIEGRPVGVIANNPLHLAGAIDSQAADKAARFMQLLETFGLPVIVLCDTPGIMVGPEAEKSAIVRHASRMFVTGANLTVPVFMVILRKAYGLGAMAMGTGSLAEPFFVVAWPTAEFAGMGIEGQVRLGYRAELEAIEEPVQRKARYDALIAQAYENGKAIHQGETFGVDDVIDPMDTRRWLGNGLLAAARRERNSTVARRLDVW
jgi:acetyl/propionyl-CoA carboxylase alpha subunit/acetyl-CoA carboxylase carboxyltransferase component